MKRPGYREALEWMALNDDVYWLAEDPTSGAGAISVTGAMVRDLFDVDEAKFRKDLLSAIKRVSPTHEVAKQSCTYPCCKCIVSTSTSQPEPICPLGLEQNTGD